MRVYAQKGKWAADVTQLIGWLLRRGSWVREGTWKWPGGQ